jgi:ubiquinone/menaquinone biosynthesis C-methylase UbiE
MNEALHGVMQRVHFAHGESYDRKAAVVFRGLYRRVAEDVAAAAPGGGTVLDAGCGSGRLAVEIARRRPDLRVHGIDLESGMVEVATRHAEREGLTDRVEFTVALRAAAYGPLRRARVAAWTGPVRTGWFPAALYQRLALEPA